MGFGSFLKSVAKVALPIAGTVIGGAVGGPVGASIGGSLGGAIAGGGGGQQQGGIGSAIGGIIGGISNNQAINEAQKIAQQTADKQLSILEKQYNLTRNDLLKAVSDGRIVLDNSTKQAIQTLNQGYGKAETYNTDALDRITDRLTPYFTAGDLAFIQQNDLLGINGQKAQERAYSIMEKNPQFQSLMKQSENAILQNASATGGLRGGNTQEALAKLRPQLLNQVVQQQLGNLSNVAQTGFNAKTNLQSTETGFAGQNQNLQAGLSSAIGGLQSNLGINQAELGLKAPIALGLFNQGYGQNVAGVLGGLGGSQINTVLAKNQNMQQTAGGASGGISDIVGGLVNSVGLGSVFGGGQGGGIAEIPNLLSSSPTNNGVGFGSFGTQGFGL